MQRRYVSEKNKVEADKMKLEQSYKAKIADLQAELSAYNKNLLEAQEDDVSLVHIVMQYMIYSYIIPR